MGPENPAKKIDRRERVRENQRKSRAKKQEHIRDLEQKLASFQEHLRRKDIEHRLAVQKLEAENTRLRRLLAHLGLASSEIDSYLRAGSNPVMTEKVAISPIRPVEAGFDSKHQEAVITARLGASSQSERDIVDAQPGRLPEQYLSEGDSEFLKATHLTGFAERFEKPAYQDQTICGCAPAENEKSWPTNEDILNTTLCAIAEELINQYNTRGVDVVEIRRKLWSGFSKGLTTDEGCRVQNQILFQVLDEISNN
ncbi:bZIP transcription factor [Aspergillus affinis]|uniref:bZIP transcription factor n=1 Tax=Aspergillus affinis TaxID=1070780 RepID=UPI0022FEE63A|nr:uncharacterized protein KD926_007035 [Aspergillus affinis]KAI9045734.1 hypothetical protein KD926_007035 [Aspergillus affinis]